jgi:hypothetical protein
MSGQRNAACGMHYSLTGELSTSYEVRRSSAPYFDPVAGEPVGAIDAPEPGPITSYPIAPDAKGSYFYLMRGVNASSQFSEASSRVGILRFPLVPGS